MLNLKDISYSIKTEKGQKKILKNINLNFEKGKTYVITGQNGSGKSTLVKLIMGIERQSSGEIFFEEENISDLAVNERANKGITFAFQKPVTFKGLKVKDLLDIASNQKNTLSQNCEFLSKVGLCARDYLDRYVDDKLSGGEIKRIELALSLVRNGKLDIFDEPEAGIDLWSFERLVKLFENKEKTTIIVSHQQKILEHADQIILMHDGKIRKTGTPKEVMPIINNSVCGKLRGQDE